MEIVNFTPLPALAGGALIGVAVSFFLLTTGRVAGISGILGGVFQPKPGDVLWRVAFAGGLVLAGAAAALLAPQRVAFDIERSVPAMIVAGLLVGFGTRLGNGCTSGHGVCGIARLSRRSMVSTLTFIASGVAVTTCVRVFFGGAL